MRRVLVVAFCALAACGPRGECRGSKCAANERCDSRDGRCVEDLAPALVVTAPLDASEVTANPLALSGTATDDDGVPKVEYSFDGATWTAVTVADDGSFSEPMTLPLLDGAPLRLTVRATDVRGQVATRVMGLSIDDVAPSCARMSPDDGQLFTHGTVAVRYAAAGYRTLEFTFDGASVTPEVAAGEVSFTWPVPLEDWVVHTVALAVTDAAGNTCLLQSTFIVDDVPPVMSFESPLDGQVFGIDDFGIAFANGPATDGSGVVDVFVDVDNGMGPIQSGVWGDHWIVGRDTPVGEDYVPHYARAIGVDLAGNSTGIDVTWFADVVPPRLMITSPSPGQLLNASQVQGDDVVVSWLVSDGDPQLVVTSPQGPGQDFLPSVTSFGLPTSPGDNGTSYTVQLTVSTRSGATTGTVSFLVDRVAPTVVQFDPLPNSRMVRRPVTATFSEPMKRQWGQWNDAGTVLQFGPTQPGFAFGFFDYGSVEDLAGNQVQGLDALAWRAPPVYWNADGGLGPDAGVLESPGATRIWAVADQESALSFAVLEVGDSVRWYQIDPSVGLPVRDLYCDQPVGDALQLGGYLPPDAGARDLRGWTFSCLGAAGFVTMVEADTTVVDNWIGAQWIVPAAPLVDESLSDVQTQTLYGAIIPVDAGVGYMRWGIPAPLESPLSIVGGVETSDTHWVMTDTGATGHWTAFGCDAGACNFIESGTFPDAVAASPYSFAAGYSCDLHLFTSSGTDGGLALETIPWTAGGCPLTGCAVTSTTPVPGATAAVVFDPRDEVTFELISSTGATFDISTGTLDSSCSPTLTHVTSFTVPQGLVSAQPVWMYGKPSALYLDANGTVRLYVSP